jgi:hypothetical protein
MKHRELTGLVASSVALLLTLGFACVDADIPNVSNDLRDALADTYGNAGAPPVATAGAAGSASAPSAGAGGDGGAAGNGGDGGDGSEPEDENGGAAGSSMAGVAGSEGEGAAGGPPAMAGGCNGLEVLQTYCATAGCHGPGSAFGEFAVSEEAAREFIGVESGLSCAGQGSIVDTDDPSASLIITKINGEAECGSPMPLTGEQLTDEEIACVEEWISGL